MSNTKSYILGVFDDERELLKAVKGVRESGTPIADVFTPFAVHGLDEALGMKNSRLPIAGFLIGATVAACAVAFMSWVNVVSYPLNFGGKPYFSLPSYVPITFEAAVLSSSIGMAVIMFAVSRLKPSPKGHVIDERVTDDKFVIAFDKGQVDGKKVNSLLKKHGAQEINEKEIDYEPEK
jgi:hypothetical protein